MWTAYHKNYASLTGRGLEALRLRLARPDALLAHAALGLLTGLLAGLVIIGFRLVVEGTLESLLPVHGENYEGLPVLWRLLLPILGAVAIALLFLGFARGNPVLGVARVMERLAYHQGYMDVRGFVLQFLSAAIAILSGHSVGREGPHVYLGASSGSLLGQALALPNNSIRLLLACGTAAGISASFNTPLAGVIFALEVLALEYSLHGFIPIILAAVSANALSVAVFGSAPTLPVPPLWLASLSDLVPVLLLGIFAGGVSAAYIQLLQSIASLGRRIAVFWRLCLAGLIAGVFGVLMPEVMGLGYDSLTQLLTLGLPWTFLTLLLLAKLLATSASVGLGIPGGTIGPALFMGAVVGNLTAAIAAASGLIDSGHASFYALLGMAAMMGASLQAPLAALTAVVELTHNPGAIMPGMMTIVLAGLISKQVFGKDSLFITVLKSHGMDYQAHPVVELLRRSGVASVMNTHFTRCDSSLDRQQAEHLVRDGLDWIIIDHKGHPAYLMPGITLASHLARDSERSTIDLLDIPGERFELAAVHLQATLQEALDILRDRGAEALYVTRPLAPGIDHIYGVLTRRRIESASRY
ncbi:chloride channel protein [Allochromatium palmeri]|uniref:Chloride channel protein n=1 Tax=Allochromatium palmeri TaxID=231048 RepID=A0A6N8EIB7_9GAMM|nr:chloride channel protein [Allochromatium palmeri]MTW22466.1 chloride channel protein [Allochromatium palmeri]